MKRNKKIMSDEEIAAIRKRAEDFLAETEGKELSRGGRFFREAVKWNLENFDGTEDFAKIADHKAVDK